MDNAITVRILVVGDDNVGKTTLVQALCGASSHTIGKSGAGCAVSVRLSEDGKYIEEYYDIMGAAGYRHGRQIFYSHRRYDGVLFVYDLTDTTSRSSISCVWVPEVMASLGDVGAIEAAHVHVQSATVVNELRFLWRQMFFSHSNLSVWQAINEGTRLLARLVHLLLNEWGIWSDPALDQQAEQLLLATTTLPVALVGMKADLVDTTLLNQTHQRHHHHHPPSKGVAHITLHPSTVAHDVRLQAFLRRVAESARRKASLPAAQSHARTPSGQVMLGFS